MFESYYSADIEVAANQNVKEKSFWLSQMEDHPEKAIFPYDYKRKRKDERSFDSLSFNFSDKIIPPLMKLSNDSLYTLNVILVTAVVVLLHKYSGSADIVVGAPIYKQEGENELLNRVLALRNRFEPGITFKDLLIQASRTIVEATEHFNYPVQLLPQQLNLPYTETGDFPLFDTMVLMENLHDRDYIRDMHVNIIFTFQQTQTGEAVTATIQYNSQLYAGETVKDIAARLEVLLEKALSDTAAELPAIEILLPGEKQRLLKHFNETKTDYPHDRTLQQLFQEQVEKTPGRTALVLDRLHVTYGELNRRANRLARLLRSRGVRADSIVGLLIRRSVNMIAGMMAILKAGGAYLPIDPDTPKNRILMMLKDCRTTVLLTDSAVIDRHSFAGLQELKTSGMKPLVTPRREQIMDFDSFPIPDRSLVDYESYNRYLGQAMVKNCISLQGTRGCPYNCAYCHKIWPKKHVFRSAENIFAEVELYYNMGVRRFAFIDDIFNLDKKNSSRFFNMVIEKGLDIQIFFPNGVRADLLTEDYIDLMIKAGTINFAFALETASPRLQKLIGKNMQLDKFLHNIEYIVKKHPQVLLELFTMHGFPSETEEEAMLTLDFIKSIRWIHFPYVFILKVYPNTEMADLALANGVSREAINRSDDMVFHELPDTLPFDKKFTLNYQANFFNEYFLSKDRLKHVLPYQMKALTEDEIVKKYNSYLPQEIHTFTELLDFFGFNGEDVGTAECRAETWAEVTNFNEKARNHFTIKKPSRDALRVLLLDLSQNFTSSSDRLRDLLEPPLGPMYLMTYLNRRFGSRVNGRIAKAQIDFDNYEELCALLDEFKPHVIGIRTLSFFKNFFHRTAAVIRSRVGAVPIVGGGPYASSGFQSMLQDENVDLAVLGEGEITFAELVRVMMETPGKLPPEEMLKQINGLAFIPQEERKKNKWGRQIIVMDEQEPALAAMPDSNLPDVNQASDLAYVIFTSGSTGNPKGTLINHFNASRVVSNTNYIRLTSGHRVLQLSNYAFDGSIFDIYGALLNGAVLVLIGADVPSGVDETAGILTRQNVDVFFVTTAFFNMMVQLYPKCFDNIKKVLFGGERVSVEHTAKALEHMGTGRIIHMYGPTETTVYATYYPVNEIRETQETIPIGRPLSNTTAYILDEHIKLVPIGGYGEVYIGSDGLSRGYLNNPELTARKFVKNPFKEGTLLYKTGDRARWLKDGNIEFVGRIDHQVKIRGFRIELGEIERRLQTHPGIKEAVVQARTGDEGAAGGGPGMLDRYLCAYITADKKLDTREIKTFLSKELPDFMIPAYIEQLDKMPLTRGGKIDRKSLAPVERKAGAGYVPPEDEVEHKLVEIWSEVLGVKKSSIGTETDFFDMGGHSLKATLMASRIHEAFDVTVPLKDIFSASYIKALAQHIKDAEAGEGFIRIRPCEEKTQYPLSSAQKRLYVLQQMRTGGIAYNMPQLVVLEGRLEKKRLLNTFKRLIDRHESLRTSFHQEKDEPRQQIHGTVEFGISYYDKEPGGHWKEVKNESSGEAGEAGASDAIFDSPNRIINRFIRPFDLARAPLMRIGLIKEDERRHIMMADLHHIISDGTSMNLMIKEFMDIYGGDEPPQPGLRYRDYSEWRNGREQKEAIHRQKNYWLREFEGEIPVLDLPVDYPRTFYEENEGDSVSFELTLENTVALEELASQEGTTLYMVLLSIYFVLLSRLSGREDIVVGTPVAGRRHVDMEKIIGMFVNTLAVRTAPEGALTFTQYLEQVKEKTLKAFENQDYPFEELVEEVPVNRDVKRNPLFDVWFAFQNLERREIEIPGMTLKPYDYRHYISKFDLSLRGSEPGSPGEPLSFAFEYGAKLFKRETIERFAAFFKAIAASVRREPRKRLAEIEIISPEEKKRILYEFNGMQTAAPKEKNIVQWFDGQAAKTPDKIAQVMREEGAVTYRELNRRAGRLARILRQKGIKPGVLAAVTAARSVETITGIMGILKAGGAYLPIGLDTPAERIDYMLKDSNATVVLDREYLKNFEHGENAAIPGQEPGECAVELKSTDPVYVIYTSGTTGKPKGVMLTHRNLVNYAAWFIGKVGITGEDRSALTSSLAFDLGKTSVYPVLLGGGQLHILEQETYLYPGSFWDYIRLNRISYVKMTPSLFRVMVEDESFTPAAGRSLRQVVLGGEAVDVTAVEKAHAVCPHIRVMNHYGPTEATIGCVAHMIDTNRLEEYKKNPIIGVPIDGATALILNGYSELQPVGIAGELCIGGEGIARGYLNRPELTAERFIAGHSSLVKGKPSKHADGILYRTGDRARWKEDGNIEFLGRIDKQVKIRGYRIELGEIESVLKTHEIVKETVVQVRDRRTGEKYIVAYIVPGDKGAEGSWTDVASNLKEYLHGCLPTHMVPAHFVKIEKIPLTPNGKIDNKELLKNQIDGEQRIEREIAVPVDYVERTLARIWAEVLGIDKNRIGLDSDFFELGGHSLKATILIARVHRALNVKLPLEAVFRTPSIREMARYARNMKQEQYTAIEPVEEKEYYPLAPAQKRMYLSQQMNLESAVYNLPVILPLNKAVEPGNVEKIITSLVRRHDSLRTYFSMVDDEPVQRIREHADVDIRYFRAGTMEEIETIIERFVEPFDLSRAPLIRVGLMEEEEGDRSIMMDTHHIIADGISLAVLMKDFAAQLRGKNLTPLPVQYKDFAEWINSEPVIESLKQQEQYWLKQLNGPIPQLNLATDYERTEIKEFEGRTETFELGEEKTAKLKKLAKEENLTVYMVLFALFDVLLSKLSLQEDIIIGTDAAGRRHADLENVVGMFVNTLVIRAFPEGGKSFKEFLAEQGERLLGAFENQDYPFEELVSKVVEEREPGRNPLFDVMFTYKTSDAENDGDEETAIAENGDYRFENRTAKFDLIMGTADIRNNIACSFEYSTKLYKEERVRKYIALYHEILDAVLEDPTIKLKDIPVTSRFLEAEPEEFSVDFDF